MPSTSEIPTDHPSTVREATREFSTATLGWRDLPVDGVVTVNFRYSTTVLHDATVRYDGDEWSCTVCDPARGRVRLDTSAGAAPSGAARRAIHAALDQVGIHLDRDC